MVPYIALLIVLIVVILFSVYNRVDGFFVEKVNWSDNTTVKEMITFYEESLEEATKLKDKIASAPPFDDGITQEKLLELGVPFIWTQEKGLEYDKPLSALLAKAIEEDRKSTAQMIEEIKKSIQSGKIKETMTLADANKAMGNEGPSNMSALNQFINMSLNLRDKRKAFVDEKLGVSAADIAKGGFPELSCPQGRPPFSQNGKVYCRDMLGKVSDTPLICPVGTVPFFVFEPSTRVLCVPPTLPYAVNPQAATSGGSIKACNNGDMVGISATDNLPKCIPAMAPTAPIPSAKSTSTKSTGLAGVSVDDLFGAVGGVQQALKASKPGEVEKEQAPAPESTVLSTKEMEDRIAKSVATQLKDSLLVERATKNVKEDLACPYASYQSNSVAQGTEFTHAKPHPGPDMSEYIRKDSIPCWNCSLP